LSNRILSKPGHRRTSTFNYVRDTLTIGGLAIVPVAINNGRQATGSYTTGAGINRAFVWQDGVATDLGTLSGYISATGNGINDRGQVVGQSCSTTTCSGFLWQNGVMTDLNAVVPASSSLYMFDPAAINSRGEIVGLAIDKTTGQLRAFLAMPCDEEHTKEVSCKDEGASMPLGQTSQNPKIAVPENVRKLLQGRLGARYHVLGGF
jgi:probable HAF family extracellular repeat protein